MKPATKIFPFMLFSLVPTACDLDGTARGLEDLDRDAQNTSTITVQAKSFIAPLGAADLVTPLGWTTAAGQAAYTALVAATNVEFSENPADGTRESAEYRLWTEFSVTATCIGNQMVDIQMVDAPDADVGYEGQLRGTQAPIPVEIDSTAITDSTNTVTGYDIHFVLPGAPNPAAEPVFQAVRFRNTPWIYNDSSIRVLCEDSEVTTITTVDGSAFPSHRVWVTQDGVTEVFEKPQEHFRNLWSLPPRPRLGVNDIARTVIGDSTRMTEHLVQPGGFFLWERVCDIPDPESDQLPHDCTDWVALEPEGVGPIGAVGMYPIYPKNGDVFVRRATLSLDGKTSTADDCAVSGGLLNMASCTRYIQATGTEARGGYDAYSFPGGDNEYQMIQQIYDATGTNASSRLCEFNADRTDVDWDTCKSAYDPSKAWHETTREIPLAGYGVSGYLFNGFSKANQTIIERDLNPNGTRARGSSYAKTRVCDISNSALANCGAWTTHVIGGQAGLGLLDPVQ